MQKPPKKLWQIVPHPIQMQAALLCRMEGRCANTLSGRGRGPGGQRT